jgi:DNA mismatch repair ATPase MutS
MKFEIDNQTLKDLNIFGASQNDKSLFSIFDSTLCMGGKKVLSSFFSKPSDDLIFISERKETIAFLQKHLPEGMKLDKNALDFAEYYFRHANFSAEKPSRFAVIKKLFGKLNNSKKHHLVNKGVVSTVQLIKSLHSFAKLLMQKADLDECPLQLRRRVEDLWNRIALGEFKGVLDSARLNAFNMARLDYVFRNSNRSDVSFFFEFIYEFDAYITVANTARKYGFCYPEIVPEGEQVLELEGLFHPLIENAVASDVVMNRQKRLLFISGPNMAGKSTFLKSLGLAAYLAHIGFPVPASKMKVSLLSGISTTINLADDLNLGYSHFFAEVKRIKDVARKLETNKNMLVIFDELFRGTNVKDAYDGTLAIASAFSSIDTSFFVISSHIVEVADELKKQHGIMFGFFEVKQQNNATAYTYLLKEGISDLRLGMHIIHQEGLIDLIHKISENNNNKR